MKLTRIRAELSRLRARIAGLRFEWHPVDTLALMLVGVGVAAIVLWFTVRGLRDWSPNIATEAFSIAIAIAVVDRIVRRSEERRVARRLAGAYARLDHALGWFVRQLLMDYAVTRRYAEVSFSFEPVEIIRRWTADPEDTPRLEPTGSPFVLIETLEFADTVKRVADADRDVLPHDLVAAMNGIEEARAHKAPDLTRAVGGVDTAGFQRTYDDWFARWIIHSIEAFAIAYRDVRKDVWPMLYNDTFRLEAVEPEN